MWISIRAGMSRKRTTWAANGPPHPLNACPAERDQPQIVAVSRGVQDAYAAAAELRGAGRSGRHKRCTYPRGNRQDEAGRLRQAAVCGAACAEHHAEHLAKHPGQKVAAMKLLVTADHPPDEKVTNYSF